MGRFFSKKHFMAEIDKHWLVLAYGAVVSSSELYNSNYDARNTSWLEIFWQAFH